MADSVAGTGAVPGDKVKCKSTNVPGRFRPGQVYEVINFCGTPSVRGHTDYKGAGNDPGWNIPWRGYGAEWEKVNA